MSTAVDIAAWLRGLGLEQYERAFLDNDIDAEVLPELTAEDLVGLGVTSIGHRKRLLKAIDALMRPSASAGNEAAPTEPAIDRPTGVAQPERRQLTVLFCDLVGSTELAARLDPEDTGALIGAYQGCCAAVVRRWDGHIAKYMGDGVLAYFGWPRAHEDDAERAVRAGLDLVRSVAELPAAGTHGPLAARVGIATGLVMVGGLIAGEGAAREQAVIGETPNLAARLQALAAPGAVVIASGTQRLLGDLFELTDLDAHSLKGFAAPVRAWRVTAESRAESRFQALHGARLTPLIGRDEELSLLLSRWRRARAGEGQVVLLAGEPGVGKSRIVQALRGRLEGETYTPLSHFCSPYHVNSVLHPVIGLLERAAGFGREDSPADRLAKLEALLARSTERLQETVPLIAELLGIPVDERYAPLNLSPQRQKLRTLEVLVEQVEGLAARQPVLAVYEDAHWMDPTTLEALGLLIDRAPRLPVLVLITYRPEFTPPWVGHAHVTQLSLARLTRGDGASLVERLTIGKALPGAVLEQILAKTDGVPLFIEELTKAVLESGLLRDAGDRYELIGPLQPLAIPATLHDSLMARLDRLAPVKEVAQIAAVIGREFSHELLAAVSPLSEAELTAALDRLVRAELIFRRGTPPEASYSFKHALVRDAAYQSLLRARRQQLHAKIADVFERRFPETVVAKPEVVAHHCTEAGLADRAVRYWQAAGKRAAERSANPEAIGHLTKALELLRALPDSPERTLCELDLLTALGPALMATKGYGAPEVERAYARARELCQQKAGDEDASLFSALQGLWGYYNIRTEFPVALELGGRCLSLSERLQDPALRQESHRLLGATSFWTGDLAAARAHVARGIALRDSGPSGSLAFRFGQDPGVSCLSYAALALCLSGFQDQAAAKSKEALALARELSHPYTLAYALFFTGVLPQPCGDHEAALARAETLVNLAREQTFPLLLAGGQIQYGAALAAQRQGSAGIAQILQGLTVWRATGSELWQPYFLALLAEAYGTERRTEEALRTLGEALAVVEKRGERWCEAELHRRKGEMVLSSPGHTQDEAEACFHRALAVSRAQGAKLWELRAATGLAHLRRDQGRRGEAYDLLAPVYGWFTEGLDTWDLRHAQRLLRELR